MITFYIFIIYYNIKQSFQTIEELIHLVERNFPVHDNQVMPADLNNDHERASDDGDLIGYCGCFENHRKFATV